MPFIYYSFKAGKDAVPVVFPPPGPFWVTGFDDSGKWTVVAVLPEGDPLAKYWPDATNIIKTAMGEHITYSDRFPRPNWYRGPDIMSAISQQTQPGPAFVARLTRPRLAAGEVLDEMARTFRERNTGYGENFRMIAPMVKVLFPEGVPPELVTDDRWHIFELVLVKISRYAISRFEHRDSIHDTGVYAAMLEALNLEKEAENHGKH